MQNTDLDRERNADRCAIKNGTVVLMIITLCNFIVNSLSVGDDIARSGGNEHWASPWIWEGSSALVILLLIPLVMQVSRYYPIESGRWARWLPVHVMACLAFSALHIVVMFGLRFVLIPVITGRDYEPAGSALSNIIYELRKDAVTYALIVFTFHMSRLFENHRMEIEAAREDAQTRHKLTLKCGGRVLRLDIDDIVWVKAASNYVEVHTATGDHLARTTLGGIESQMLASGAKVSRIHRSYLVNPDYVRELIPTGEGDARLLMKDKTEVPASRRYRENWPD